MSEAASQLSKPRSSIFALHATTFLNQASPYRNPSPVEFPCPCFAPELPPEASMPCLFDCRHRGDSPDHGGQLGHKIIFLCILVGRNNIN